MKDIISNVFEEICNSTKNNCKITGMPSGFLQLDFYTKGISPGKVYVLCGHPRVCKTALLLNISYNLGVEFPYFVRYFSLDDTPESIAKRMLFAACNVSITSLPYEAPDFEGMKRLFVAGERLKKSSLKIICNNILEIEDIESECKRKACSKGVIVIDSLQLYSYGKQKGLVLKKLKHIAVKWNVAILLAYDTNNNAYVNEHFMIKNGVDSIFLLRKENTFGLNDRNGILFFSILKQKDGPSADFILNFSNNSFKIYDEEDSFFESSHSFPEESIKVC